MWQKVGIIRRDEELIEAKNFVDSILSEDIGYLLKLRALSAKKIIESAIARKESIGAHYKET